VDFTFTPTSAGPATGSITINGTHGTSLTVQLTGTGLAPVTKFVASPKTVNFGNVAVGHTATMTIHVLNAGNQPSLMRSTNTNGGAFRAPLKATPGMEVNGGLNLVLPVTFTPTKAGPYSGIYKVTWTDAFGLHSLNVPITGTGV
jgi:iron transport multicopper oxidase